jgi:predicted CoA-binding protein
LSPDPLPEPVAEFLRGKRFAVAGVSRSGKLPANAIYRRLRDSGYDAIPVNPSATSVEGVPCYPDLGSIPGPVDGVIVATHPDVSLQLVRQCAELGVKQVWFHRSFGDGSVSLAAVEECRTRGISCLVGGCPLMYCGPVDPFHRLMRWWLRLRRRVPG